MISVVILNFNGRKYMGPCLDSLSTQTYRDFEVIVVDNGSSDGSMDYMKANYPWVKMVRNERNLGFAAGTNVGIKHAQGDYILTLNNDTRADKNFIEHIVKPMAADNKVGMCAPKMLFPDGRINSVGICLSRSGAAWDRGMFEQDMGQYDSKEEVFGPCGGAALYRREMLAEIGLFDEDFFLYMEDVDLAFRARLAGWKCVYAPNARVYHFHGGTAGYGSDLSVYYGNRHIIWYIAKNFSKSLLLTSIPWIVGRNIAVIPYYALRGQGRVILKSKFDALKCLPKMLRKRGMIIRKVPERDLRGFIQTWARIPRNRDVVHRI